MIAKRGAAAMRLASKRAIVPLVPADPTAQQIREALASHQRVEMEPLPGRTNHIHAGVLLPLIFGAELSCVVTVRAAHMRQHAGEVCFPGGTREPADANLCTTALREAREEIDLRQAEVLGALSSIPLYTSDHRIFPFVAKIDQQTFRANPDEVARVIEMPLRQVFRQPSIIAIGWQQGHLTGLAPLFELDGDKLMYGATAHAFYELLKVLAPLYGLELPPLVVGRYSWADVLPPGWRAPRRPS